MAEQRAGEEQVDQDHEALDDPERPRAGNSNAEFLVPGRGQGDGEASNPPQGVDPGEPQVGNSKAKFFVTEEGDSEDEG
jgi:hypothetical protein